MNAAGALPDAPALLDLARVSPTFLPSLGALAAFGALAAAGGVGCLWFAARRRGRRSFLRLAREDAGAVLAADYILVIMPFMIFVTLMLQITWLMRETIVLHYATYAAARSARVHLCPMLPEGPLGLALQYNDLLCTDDKRGLIEKSARFALISASPPWGVPCQGACQVPRSAITAIAINTDTSGQRNALLTQARYAYDTQNVRIDVRRDLTFALVSGMNPMEPGQRLPVTVRIAFRHHILTLVGPFMGVRRSDGYFYRETSAEVTLL